MEALIKGSIGVVGAGISYVYGGWNALLIALVVFIIFDYFTGIMAAAVNGRLSAKVGMIGIAKKVFIFVMVAVGSIVDGVLGEGTFTRDTVIFFYLANELLSIIENGGKLGAPIPPFIRQAVEVLRGKGGIDEQK